MNLVTIIDYKTVGEPAVRKKLCWTHERVKEGKVQNVDCELLFLYLLYFNCCICCKLWCLSEMRILKRLICNLGFSIVCLSVPTLPVYR